MSALEKVLAARSTSPKQETAEDPAAELVLAASRAAGELAVMLADDDQDDDGEGGDDSDSDDGGGHASHATYKALVGKKVPPARAAAMCAKSDKKVKATALAEAVTVALAGLAQASGDWVEATSYDRRAVALTGKKPYGSVSYADPGHQADGKARFPTDTAEHVRTSLSYVSQDEHARKYSSEHLKSVRARLVSAARKHGIDIAEDVEDKVAASAVLQLARKPSGPPQAMGHGTFSGTHSHGHFVQQAHEHEHSHNNDSMHDRHSHGDSGQDSSGWDSERAY